jgi:hypothetical protein
MNDRQMIRLTSAIEAISVLMKDGPDWKGGIAVGKDLAAIRSAVEAATDAARDVRVKYHRLAALEEIADQHHRRYLDGKTHEASRVAHDAYLVADAEARRFKQENHL